MDFTFDPNLFPNDYGDYAAEYAAHQRGVGVLNFSSAGKFEVKGKNAVPFLNGLVTNDLKSLTPGTGTFAAFLTVQGKVLALSRFYQTEEHLLLELDAINRAKIYQNLSRFIPAGEFIIDDISERYGLISLQGPRSAEFISEITSLPADTEPFKHSQREIDGVKLRVATHARCGVQGFDLFVPITDAAYVWQEIIARGSPFGARAIGQMAFEIARIEAGIPKEPDEVNENYILLETGCEDAISYTKGCYLGQEIIARIHWRGQPAKRLMGLFIEASEVPSKGTEMHTPDGKKVGEITSSGLSLKFNRIIALGYIHRYHLTPRTKLILKSEGLIVGEAEVTSLPFSLFS